MDVLDSAYADWYASGWENATPSKDRFDGIDSFIVELASEYDRGLQEHACRGFSDTTRSDMLVVRAIDISYKVAPYQTLRAQPFIASITHGHTKRHMVFQRVALSALLCTDALTAEDAIDRMSSDMIRYVEDRVKREIGL